MPIPGFAALTVIGGLAVGVLFFIAILRIIADIGGWTKLARTYKATAPFEGWKLHRRDAQFRYWTNYGGCVTVGANQQGFYLACFFRAFHPPLFIPWEEVSMTTHRWNVELRFAQVPEIPIRLKRKTIERMLHAQSVAMESAAGSG